MPEDLLTCLPTKLAEAIRNLGLRIPPGQVREIITELCGIRPYTADELAVLLRRNKKWVIRSYLPRSCSRIRDISRWSSGTRLTIVLQTSAVSTPKYV